MDSDQAQKLFCCCRAAADRRGANRRGADPRGAEREESSAEEPSAEEPSSVEARASEDDPSGHHRCRRELAPQKTIPAAITVVGVSSAQHQRNGERAHAISF